MCVILTIRLPSDQDPVNPALFYSKYSILEFTNPSTKSITFVPLQNTKGRQEAGGNMICEIQVLDGCIHDECGRELPTYLQNLPMMGVDGVGQIIRCSEDRAKVVLLQNIRHYAEG